MSNAPVIIASEIAPLLEFAGHPGLAERFGLTPAFLAEVTSVVPHSLWLDLVEAAVDASGDPYLGLHFGASTRQRTAHAQISPMVAMLMSAPNLRTVMGRLMEYQRLWNTGDRFELEELGARALMRFRPWGPLRPAQIQIIDKVAAQYANMLRYFGRAEPETIRLAYPRREGAEELARVLRVTPSFDASATEVVFPSAALDAPAPKAMPALFEVLDGELRRRADRTAAENTFVGRLRAEILADLSSGSASIKQLAHKLGCSARTLQRQLNHESVTIRDLLEDVRRARAQSLIETDLPLSEVAQLLGYSGRRAFHTAFRRWFGINPGQMRAERRGTSNLTHPPESEPGGSARAAAARRAR